MRRIAMLFAGIAMAATAAYSGEGNVRRSPHGIPGRYIVVLEQNADAAAVANKVRNTKGAKVNRTYERGVKGLAVEMSDFDAQALARDSSVQFVEEDAVVSASATDTTSWGLDRADQRFLPLNGTYVTAGTGAGVNVYVVDTGILSSHSDLGGRVSGGFNALSDNGTGPDDCNGHGTHVAGVIAGADYGVAKAATLIPVRVLGCDGSGSVSTVIAGLEWILQDHAQNPHPAVVNMSLGGAPSAALDNEVITLIGAGITTVVAAGNRNEDACNVSPARVIGALTVGASDETDTRASWSNYGPCVDLFAPGTNIISDSFASTTALAISNGTSAAAPFVAGVAALTLEQYPDASPAAVAQTVVSQATLDVLTDVGAGSPNRLVFALIDSLADPSQSDSQLLADPSFEYGETFWIFDLCTVIKSMGCGAWDNFLINSNSRSGKSHASIGGPAKTFHVTSEAVTIPASVGRAELSFYLWVTTKNKKSSASDILTVEIRDAAGNVIETLGKFSNLDTTPTYSQRRFDVSRHRGETIRISFTGVQNPGPPTYFNLDDIGLNVWH